MTISNAVQITTTSLPNGTNGLNYSQQLQAAAGVPFVRIALQLVVVVRQPAGEPEPGHEWSPFGHGGYQWHV